MAQAAVATPYEPHFGDNSSKFDESMWQHGELERRSKAWADAEFNDSGLRPLEDLSGAPDEIKQQYARR